MSVSTSVLSFGRSATRFAGAAVAGLALAGLMLPSAAHAQRASDDYFPSSVWQAGGGVVVAPRFEGSNRYQAIAFPIIAPASFSNGGDGVVQVRGADDVRLRLLTLQGFEFGALAGYRMGRDAGDSTKLTGFNNIDGGLVLGGFAGYRFGGTLLSVSYHRQVSGEDTGGVVRLMAEQTMRLDKSTKLVASIGTNIADKDYMQTYFGVTAAQAGALPAYAASSGFKDAFAGLTATIDLDRQWTFYVAGRYTRLVGDAANSPVIDTSNQFYGGAGLTFKFNTGR